jgi:hypothetical protein
MKNIFTSCIAAVVMPASVFAQEAPKILATTQGHYALGSVDETFAGTLRKVIYLIDTKTGAVWEKGCVQWDQNDKCTVAGLRSVSFGDGAGSKLFNNAKEAAEGANFGSLIREHMNKR